MPKRPILPGTHSLNGVPLKKADCGYESPRAVRQHVAGASDVTYLDAGALPVTQFAPQVADVSIDAAVPGGRFAPEHAFRQSSRDRV
jgi:hypothetical protein